MDIAQTAGHIYSAEEPGPGGYGRTVISFEAERGQLPILIDLQRPLDRAEVEALMRKLAEIYGDLEGK